MSWVGRAGPDSPFGFCDAKAGLWRCRARKLGSVTGACGAARDGRRVFTLADGWSKRLFLSLLRRYELKPYRYRSQRRTTVMVRVPKGFVDKTLWPHFQRANEELRRHLDEVAERVIGAAMEAGAGGEEVREQEQQLLPLTTFEDSAEQDRLKP